MYLDELVQKIKDMINVDISASSLCRLLRRYGITRKKIRQVAKQRCYTLRGIFMAHSFQFDVNMFVWLDETGTDKRDQFRKYGYALRGVTPLYHRTLSRGERINAIAAMSSKGIVGLELIQGSINENVLYDFLRGCLIPNMQQFPNPESVLIMTIALSTTQMKLLEFYNVQA